MADVAMNEKAVAELVKLGKQTGVPNTPTGGNVDYVVIPQDSKLVSLVEFKYNEHQERPDRKRGTVKVLDSPSFCEYYTLFHDENSRVFADETRSEVLAVLDYHGTGDNAPRWGHHRLELTLRRSKEFAAWKGNDGKKLAQMDFAEFIEDNGPDVVTPDAATMLEMARGLSAKTDVDFSSAIRVANGSVKFSYNEQVKGTYGAGNLEVPEQFVIAIPVYVGCDRVKITARMRYRITSGKLTFFYNLLRADVVERDAFLAARDCIAKGLSLTIINGTPAA